MNLYAEGKSYKLYHGDMLNMLSVLEPNSIDSIVTDPPYELNFMSKGWDSAGVSFSAKTWKKCFEVLKPGGHLLAFGGSRTFHRIACAIEDAGFEIRDTIMWIYGSGFPKSMNIANGVEAKLVTGSANKTKFSELNGEKVERGDWGIQTSSKKYGHRNKDYSYETDKTCRLGKLEPTTELARQWQGWGSSLKPSFEPIIVARKPLDGSLINNIISHGVGGLNIDECRVPMSDSDYIEIDAKSSKNPTDNYNSNPAKKYGDYSLNIATKPHQGGRFPANTILTYDETDYDEVCGGFPSSGSGNNKGVYNYSGREYNNKDTSMFNGDKPQAPSNYNDNGSASRYFYCAKASKKDRDEGLDSLESRKRFQQGNYSQSPVCSVCGKTFNGTNDHSSCGEHTMIYKSKEKNMFRKNIHPTVKPTELMQYLVRLVTPKGGTILDPFNGSGSTGKAVMYENREKDKGYKYIGIELMEEYLPIAESRIRYALKSELPEEMEVVDTSTKAVVSKHSCLQVDLWGGDANEDSDVC